ncbi:MAG: MerC domain-containing protein [Thermaurantimonas sp.]
MMVIRNTDIFGTARPFLVAISFLCCFPLFAFAASTLGPGSFELFGGWTIWIFQALVLISVAGLYISYRVHRHLYPLLIAVANALLIFYAFHFDQSDARTYIITLVCSDF